MSLGFDYFRHEISWPVTGAPVWAERVERWYQLDPPAYVMADAYHEFSERLGPLPDWLILASPGASNFTDAQFAANPPSPARFVHTLPNIRGVSLLQLMKWGGQVLCLQKDPVTVISALNEALALAETERAHVWVAGARSAGPLRWVGEFYVIGSDGGFQAQYRGSGGLSTQDDEWWKWLGDSERKFVADRYEIFKK